MNISSLLFIFYSTKFAPALIRRQENSFYEETFFLESL